MQTIYILFNPFAGRESNDKVEKLKVKYEGTNLIYEDVTKIGDLKSFITKTNNSDIIICGGDGTLNKFINRIKGFDFDNQIYYFPTGTGNDFLRDITSEEIDKPINITKYLKDLPTVIVNGKEYLFLNGVGYGIDGYCCEVGDKLKLESDKPVNYTAIAIKGLLFHYKPTNATVIVDGKEYKFKKVWIAPTMKGGYYGGGMNPTPNQNRNEKDKLSLMIFHGSSKIKTLMIFPSIFKGEHVKKTKYVTILEGRDISVKFDEPRALQIDGETILDVTEYHASI